MDRVRLRMRAKHVSSGGASAAVAPSVATLSKSAALQLALALLAAPLLAYGGAFALFATDGLLYRLQMGTLMLACLLIPGLSAVRAVRGEMAFALALFVNVFGLLMTPLLFGMGIVLLGAPVSGFWEETATLACMLSVLVGVPLLTRNATDLSACIRFVLTDSGRTLADATLAWPVRGTVLGAWLGAAALPLDWDRWWQQWPLPCAFGALAGWCLGCLCTAVLVLFAKTAPRADTE